MRGYVSIKEEIEKQPRDSLDFSKIKVGKKTLTDSTFDLNQFEKRDNSFSKKNVLDAINNKDYKELRKISNFFFTASGIYGRMCKYLAYLYRYDWYIIPYIKDNNSEKKNQEKILTDFYKVLDFFEESQVSKICGNIGLSIAINGCYYGYVVDSKEGIYLQELPSDYCRSRFIVNGEPAVEFNMAYFDEAFPDAQYRMRILNSFPKEFAKGYSQYKKKQLKPDFQGDKTGWYLLDENAVKLTFGGSKEMPALINAIPAIIDLSNAQELDRKKTMQDLVKIIIQQLPLDKNGDLIFDMSEAADIHSMAVNMLRGAVGVDVMTTFADIETVDLSDSTTATTKDNLSKVERSVYNEFGVSRNLFNAESNLALEKSILDDEASIRNFPLQLQNFFNSVLNRKFNNNKKYKFKFKMLETTIYNYKDLSKMYKEHTQLGYSKMLPQIALGHSQSEILSTATFENEILNLTEIMVPPLMSSTMSSEQVLGKNNQKSGSNPQNQLEEKKNGRPEKEDSEKSEKTIANKESM